MHKNAAIQKMFDRDLYEWCFLRWCMVALVVLKSNQRASLLLLAKTELQAVSSINSQTHYDAVPAIGFVVFEKKREC